MPVQVSIPTILRSYTDGAKRVEAEGKTLDELIGDLEARHPGIGARLLENGELRRFVNVYLNDEDVRLGSGLKEKVSEADEISIVPAVAGG